MLSVNYSFRVILSTLRRSPSPLLAKLVSRQLYNPAALGLENYVNTRSRVKSQFMNLEDKFKTKMNDYAEQDSNSMIFTEDLKHMIHLIEATDEDLDIVQRMMLKFAKQNKESRFGSFIFGPVVMRMYYHLNKPKEALQMFTHPEMDGFFDQLVSFQVLLDLLFINQMYEEMIKVFDIIQKKQLQGSKYPKNSVLLVLAACYKLNTKESFLYMKKLWSDLTKSGYYPIRRSATFAAALAINQNAPDVALEILSSLRQQNYVTIRSLKLAAFAVLNRLEDALPILRAGLQVDVGTNKKYTFSEEILAKVQDALERCDNNSLKQEFDRVINQLKSFNQIVPEPLDAVLCSEISAPLMTEHKPRDRQFFGGTRQYRNTRPGLDDMY